MFRLLRGRALLQAALALILGGGTFTLVGWWGCIACGLCCALALVLRHVWIALLCACGIAGAMYAAAKATAIPRLEPGFPLPAKLEVRGRVVGIPVQREQFTSALIIVEAGGLPTGTRLLMNTGPSFSALPGDRVHVSGRVGELRSPYYRRRGVSARIAAKRSDITRLTGKLPTPPAVIGTLRYGAENRYAAQMPSRAAALTSGVVFGDDGRVPTETRDAMKRAGTYHLLAASGLNVAVVAGILVGLGSLLRLSRRVGLVAAMLGVWAYSVAAGATPPSVRAAVAISVYLTGAALGRRPDAITALAAAALYQFVREPAVIREPGFQLSYVVAGGLIVWASPAYWYLRRHLPGQRERAVWQATMWLAAGLLASLIASVAASPLLAFYFGSVPVMGPFANVVCVPASVAVLWGGLIGPALWWLPYWEQFWLVGIVAPCTQAIAAVSSYFGSLPGAVITVPEHSALLPVAFYTLFFGLAPTAEPKPET